MIKNSLIVFIFSIIFSSCTIHNGQLLDLNYGVTSPVSEKAYGYAKATYVLGLGGNKTSSLILEAKENLISNRNLVDKEEFANININKRTTFFFPIIKKTIFISADIKNPSKLKNKSSFFNIGDTLYNAAKEKIGICLGQYRPDKLLIKKESIRKKIKLVNTTECFKFRGSFNGYSIGDKVEAPDSYGYYKEVIIKGMGLNHFIVRNESTKRTRKIKSSDLKSKN